MTTPAERPRVLFDDDEPNILDALRRQLRRHFIVETALGAANGLFVLGQNGPFAVVVSDFMMPGINGADMLAIACKVAPDTTRMLLTGQANLEGAAMAINQGQVYRMLLKPTDSDTLVEVLNDCVAQYRLRTAERELLEQTLGGVVKTLTDVLALASPLAFARAGRVHRTMVAMLDQVEADGRWALELAAMMCELGVVALPSAVTRKLECGAHLIPKEQEMLDAVPEVAEQLLAPIARMAPVREAIRYSRKRFDGSGPPDDALSGEAIPLGGRLLHLIHDFDTLVFSRGMSASEAVASLRRWRTRYDPALLDILSAVMVSDDEDPARSVGLDELQCGMVLATDVETDSGLKLIRAGQEVTIGVLARLRNFAAEGGITETVLIQDRRAAASPRGQRSS